MNLTAKRACSVLLAVVALLVALIGLPTVSGAAGQAGNLVLILDASGSMWGQVEGQAKIAIAKEVMIGLIKDLPQGLKVGLVAYGHRRKGDCNDVEELVPLGPMNKDGLIKLIQAINPKGKTPITLSVRMTAQKLKALEDETTIVLVSDGQETCEGDPCALVKELKESGVKFVMHVIGFDVTDEEKKQLECMAQAGGGEYFTAKTAKDFQMAAQKVVEETKPLGFLKVRALRDGQPIAALVDVFIPEEEKSVATATTSTDPDKPTTIRLKPGKYAVTFTDSQVAEKPSVTFPDLVIEVGKTVEKTADFSGGTLKVQALKGGKEYNAYVKVFAAGQEEELDSAWTNPGEPVVFKLKPGTYDLKVQDTHVTHKPIVEVTGIELASGTTVEKVVELATEGVLKVQALKGGKEYNAYVKVFPAGQEEEVDSAWTNPGEPVIFRLKPGAYDLKVQDTHVTQKPIIAVNGIELASGDTVEKKVEFGVEAVLKVQAIKGGKEYNAYVKVFEAGQEEELDSAWTNPGEPVIFRLKPGAYDLKVQDTHVTDKPIVEVNGIELASGATVEKKIEFGVEAILKVQAIKGGKEYNAYVRVFPAGQDEAVNSGWTNPGEPVIFRLKPGAYDLKVQDTHVTDKPIVEVNGIELASGATVEKKIEFGVEAVLKVQAIKGGKEYNAYVRVFEAGQDEAVNSGWTNPDQPVVFRLKPGAYDLKVQDTHVTEKPIVEVTGLELASGATVEKKIEFGVEAVLKVQAIKGGKEYNAYVRVFPAGQDEAVNSGWTNPDQPVVFRLKPGAYDLKVQDTHVTHKPVIEVTGIELASGATVEKKIEFGVEAVLKVQAIKGGQEYNAWVGLYEAGKDERVNSGWTNPGRPVVFKLKPGVYDLKVQDAHVIHKPVISVTGIELASGATVEKKVEFEVEAVLKVQAIKGGKEYNAWVGLYEAGKDERVTSGWTNPGRPVVFKLKPGTYDLKIQDAHVIQKPIVEVTGIELASGATVEKKVEFGVEAVLKVQAIKGGQEYNAWVGLYEAGKDERVTSGWTNPGRPVIFRLVPGKYDLKVQDAKAAGKPVVDVPGIDLASGATVEKRVELPSGN